MSDQFECDLLCRLAYQSWLDRGQPFGSPEVDWEAAKRKLGIHPPVSVPTPEIPANLEQSQHIAARAHP